MNVFIYRSRCQMITLKQQGKTRRVYPFEKSWGRDGGALFGANFFTDICSVGRVESAARESTRVTQIGIDAWEIASIDTDPDFLLYMWKKGRGERFDFYIQEGEIIFLHEFFRRNGFPMMLYDVEKAAERLEKNKESTCVLL